MSLFRNLLDYYNVNRQVGHTTLMTEGLRRYDGAPVCITADLNTAKRLKSSGLNRVSFIGLWKFTEGVLTSRRSPLALDNSAIVQLLSRGVELERQIVVLQEQKKGEAIVRRHLDTRLSEAQTRIRELETELLRLAIRPSRFKLEWSEERPPCAEVGYNHCEASTPFGRFLLTWKGRKEDPEYGFDETPWGEAIYPCVDSLEETKRWAQTEYDKRTRAIDDRLPELPPTDN